VASRLLARGTRVIAADRNTSAIAALAAAGAMAVAFDALRPATWSGLMSAVANLGPANLGPDYAVLLSIPPLVGEREEVTAALLLALPRPARVVYLSSTAVYGEISAVDETTPPRAGVDQSARLAVEHVVAGGSWSWMELRAAAIYGPDRGLHVAEGSAPRHVNDPHRVVSRIHVDDLAACCEAALAASETGAFPVADLEPASATEIAAFCASLGLVPPALSEGSEAGRRPARRADGRALFRTLGVSLSYPSYREGIRAAVRASTP
jgi:nucleoside-diphosphate-sugar epimerase